MGYSFRLAARVLLYASSHRQDNTYHDLCYTSRGALAGTRNTRWLGIVSHQCEDVCHLIQDRTVQTWIEIDKQYERGNFTLKKPCTHNVWDMIRVGMVFNVMVQFGQSIQWGSVPGYIPQ